MLPRMKRLLLAVVALLACSLPLRGQSSSSGIGITFQNGGVILGPATTVNCSTGMSCTISGTTVTLTSTGGGGGVSSVSGDGTVITNSASTGAVTLTVTGTSGGVPYFSSTSGWASSALLASGGVVLGGGAATAPLTSTQLTFAAPTLTIGLAGTSSGILKLAGSTSGGATYTAPAVAGTATNPVVSSNALEINLTSATAAALTFADTATGWGQSGTGVWKFFGAGTDTLALANSIVRVTTATGYAWSNSSSSSAATQDTCAGRNAAGIVSADTSTCGNALGTFNATGYQAGGTAGLTETGTLCTATFTTKAGLVTVCTAASDARLKTDIHPYVRGLADVMKLRPASYRWNAEGRKVTGLSSDTQFDGFIAQNVKQVMPEAVGTETHDGVDYLSLPQGDRPIVAAEVNAIQQQQAEIKRLEREVARLRHEIEARH